MYEYYIYIMHVTYNACMNTYYIQIAITQYS